MIRTILFLLAFGWATIGQAQDEFLNILDEEITREFEHLSKLRTPVYFMSYHVSDMNSIVLSSSFGNLMNTNSDHSRLLNIDIKLGNYDSSTDGKSNQYGMRQAIPLPITNSEESIKQTLWMATDIMYKMSSASYNPNADASDKTQSGIQKLNPETYYDEELPSDIKSIDTKEWIRKLNELSIAFKGNKDYIQGDVILRYVYGKKYFISSEGTKIIQNEVRAEIQIAAAIRSADGEVIPLHQNYFARIPSELPDQELIQSDIERMTKTLTALQTAEKAEPFAGPAIFSGGASGVFFHEIFGHRIEADRLSSEFDSQTFKDKLGERVLPKFLQVRADPTAKTYNGKHMTGTYKYDDQGVKSKEVTLVENGILKDLLRSRTPLSEGKESNGHARAYYGNSPVSRQSNLIIESSNSKSEESLRKMLIKECKKQDKAFGYYIKQVSGGYTMTDRFRPNAFSIAPTEVYKIYVDGRPDEIVRGVDLIGTPLTMFSEIRATGEDIETFFGYCGAESGYIPVTATSPSLFVRKIETQKKLESNVEQPILEEPNNFNK